MKWKKLCCPSQLLRFSQSRGVVGNNAGSAGGRDTKSQGRARRGRGSPVLEQVWELKATLRSWGESGWIGEKWRDLHRRNCYETQSQIIWEIACTTNIMRKKKLFKPKLLAGALWYEGQTHVPGAVLNRWGHQGGLQGLKGMPRGR